MIIWINWHCQIAGFPFSVSYTLFPSKKSKASSTFTRQQGHLKGIWSTTKTDEKATRWTDSDPGQRPGWRVKVEVTRKMKLTVMFSSMLVNRNCVRCLLFYNYLPFRGWVVYLFTTVDRCFRLYLSTSWLVWTTSCIIFIAASQSIIYRILFKHILIAILSMAKIFINNTLSLLNI